MSANTIAPTIARLPGRSATGNATARPDRRLPMHARPHAVPKHSTAAPHSTSLSQPRVQNHMTLPPQRRHPTPRGATKSP